MRLEFQICVFWSFVLCLWADHSKFMSLIYVFNFWWVKFYSFVSYGCFNFFCTSFPAATRGLELFSGAYLNKMSVSMTSSD